MHKKIFLFTSLCITFHNFQIQTSQLDDRNTALGIGLFAGTAIVAKQYISHKKRTQDESAIDLQRMIRGHQAREQAAALKSINLSKKQNDAALKIQSRQVIYSAHNQLIQLRKQNTEQAEMAREEHRTLSIPRSQRVTRTTSSNIFSTLPAATELAQRVRTIDLFYVPGSFNAHIHKTHEQALLAHQDELNLFAKKLEKTENAIVNIRYFQWGGEINEQKRYEAGQSLAQAISETSADETITVSHSHGGNVVFHAAQALKSKKISIDRAILFGCPGEDSKINIHENNIKKIVNIYGDADFTGAAGSFLQSASLQSILQPCASRTTTSLRKETNNAVNIQLKVNGEDMRHRETVAHGLENLPEIMQSLNTTYHGAQNVIINASHDGLLVCLENRNPQATSEMEHQSKKNAETFKNKYDGQSIFAKKSMTEKFDEEVTPFLPQRFAPIAQAVVGFAEKLLYNPIEDVITRDLKKIKEESDFEQQTLLYHQLGTQLYKQYSPEIVQYALQHHEDYCIVKEDLERKQFFLQCITDRTKSYADYTIKSEDEERLKNLQLQLTATRNLYDQINSNEVYTGFLLHAQKTNQAIPDSLIQEMLSGYDRLTPAVQQIFISSLKPEIQQPIKAFLKNEFELV